MFHSSFLSVSLKDAILDVITSVISGEVETVTEQTTKAKAIAKGTPEREEDKAWSSEFKHAVAGKHASVPGAEEGLNRGTLGMSAKEFQENTGCSAPIRRAGVAGKASWLQIKKAGATPWGSTGIPARDQAR
jgi:hypothetical protein